MSGCLNFVNVQLMATSRCSSCDLAIGEEFASSGMYELQLDEKARPRMCIVAD